MIINKSRGASENQILAAAHMVADYFYPNYGQSLPNWILVPAIRKLVESKPDASPEDLFESFVAQSEGRYRKYLSRYVAALSTSALASRPSNVPDVNEISVFTGSRRFSFAKLSAMVSFFAVRENPICKQKLNALLFYSDFTNFYLYDRSISGARYTRQRTSPALHRYECILKTLLFAGVIRRETGMTGGKVIAAVEPKLDDLSLLETVTMYRVNRDFGPMTSAEICDYAQKESVYRFTRRDDYIPYAYARLLANLPDVT